MLEARAGVEEGCDVFGLGAMAGRRESWTPNGLWSGASEGSCSDDFLEAVKQYRFKPAMENGKPVAVELNVSVNVDVF